jgi:hypothetical protein
MFFFYISNKFFSKMWVKKNIKYLNFTQILIINSRISFRKNAFYQANLNYLKMSQNTTITNDYENYVYMITSYIPVVIIALGLAGNASSFLLFVFNKEMNKYSSMIFLAVISITDTIGLFIWNLNHFLNPNFQIYIENVNIFNCKFFTFLQYYTLQASGLLYSIISIDRYFSVISKPGSLVSRLPFGTPKSALIWSIFILITVFLFNTHLLVLNGYYETKYTNVSYEINTLNGTAVLYKVQESLKLSCYVVTSIKLWPLWDVVQAVVYTFIPFFVMSIFNTLLVVNGLKTFQSKNSINQASAKRKIRLTISLTAITFAFIIMTSPGTIAYGFFVEELYITKSGRALLTALDSLMFLQQTLIFWISYLTNNKFSQIVNGKFRTLFCICRRKLTAENASFDAVREIPISTEDTPVVASL